MPRYTQRGHNLREPVRWASEPVEGCYPKATGSEAHRTGRSHLAKVLPKPQFVTACGIAVGANEPGYSPTYGSMAMNRARLMAVLTAC